MKNVTRVAIGGMLGVFVLGPAHAQIPATKAPATKMTATKPATAVSTQLMAADRCLGDPKFVEKLGLSRRAMVDTTQTQPVGLTVIDVDSKGQPGRRVQHESWAAAGYLGTVQRDTEGNVFVYPAPSFTIEKNPPEKSNVLYRVDSATGIMAPFVEIEKLALNSSQNPYGILATTFDCVSKSLYVTSVYGSTPGTAHGTISVVDTTTGAARVALKSFDAFSLVVAHFPQGRRLVYAAAREPSVFSRGIQDDGMLANDERLEIALDDWPQLGDRKARRLRIDPQGRLLVRVQPFDFSLSASSTIARAEMMFDYDAKVGRFKFRSATETPVTGMH